MVLISYLTALLNFLDLSSSTYMSCLTAFEWGDYLLFMNLTQSPIVERGISYRINGHVVRGSLQMKGACWTVVLLEFHNP